MKRLKQIFLAGLISLLSFNASASLEIIGYKAITKDGREVNLADAQSVSDAITELKRLIDIYHPTNIIPEKVYHSIDWMLDENTPWMVSQFQEGQNITLPNNPHKDGYSFIGWEPTVPAKMPTYDLVEIAKWKEDVDYPYVFTRFISENDLKEEFSIESLIKTNNICIIPRSVGRYDNFNENQYSNKVDIIHPIIEYSTSSSSSDFCAIKINSDTSAAYSDISDVQTKIDDLNTDLQYNKPTVASQKQTSNFIFRRTKNYWHYSLPKLTIVTAIFAENPNNELNLANMLEFSMYQSSFTVNANNPGNSHFASIILDYLNITNENAALQASITFKNLSHYQFINRNNYSKKQITLPGGSHIDFPFIMEPMICELDFVDENIPDFSISLEFDSLQLSETVSYGNDEVWKATFPDGTIKYIKSPLWGNTPFGITVRDNLNNNSYEITTIDTLEKSSKNVVEDAVLSEFVRKNLKYQYTLVKDSNIYLVNPNLDITTLFYNENFERNEYFFIDKNDLENCVLATPYEELNRKLSLINDQDFKNAVLVNVANSLTQKTKLCPALFSAINNNFKEILQNHLDLSIYSSEDEFLNICSQRFNLDNEYAINWNSSSATAIIYLFKNCNDSIFTFKNGKHFYLDCYLTKAQKFIVDNFTTFTQKDPSRYLINTSESLMALLNNQQIIEDLVSITENHNVDFYITFGSSIYSVDTLFTNLNCTAKLVNDNSFYSNFTNTLRNAYFANKLLTVQSKISDCNTNDIDKYNLYGPLGEDKDTIVYCQTFAVERLLSRVLSPSEFQWNITIPENYPYNLVFTGGSSANSWCTMFLNPVDGHPNSIIFENKTINEIKNMPYYPFCIFTNTTIVAKNGSFKPEPYTGNINGIITYRNENGVLNLVCNNPHSKKLIGNGNFSYIKIFDGTNTIKTIKFTNFSDNDLPNDGTKYLRPLNIVDIFDISKRYSSSSYYDSVSLNTDFPLNMTIDFTDSTIKTNKLYTFSQLSMNGSSIHSEFTILFNNTLESFEPYYGLRTKNTTYNLYFSNLPQNISDEAWNNAQNSIIINWFFKEQYRNTLTTNKIKEIFNIQSDEEFTEFNKYNTINFY